MSCPPGRRPLARSWRMVSRPVGCPVVGVGRQAVSLAVRVVELGEDVPGTAQVVQVGDAGHAASRPGSLITFGPAS